MFKLDNPFKTPPTPPTKEEMADTVSSIELYKKSLAHLRTVSEEWKEVVKLWRTHNAMLRNKLDEQLGSAIGDKNLFLLSDAVMASQTLLVKWEDNLNKTLDDMIAVKSGIERLERVYEQYVGSTTTGDGN